MISITTSQPVQWSVAPVAPQVAAVGGVPRVSATGRDQAAGQQTGGRNEARAQRQTGEPAERSSQEAAHAGGSTPGAQAAPLLPRERGGKAAGDPAYPARERADASDSQQEAEASERDAAERQPALLQEVLSSVWQASAAVVNVVLGRAAEEASQNPAEAGQNAQGPKGATGAAGTAGTAGATGLQPSETPAQAAARRMEELLEQELSGGARGGQDAVVYTEQGTSSFAPLESGTLVSERV